MWMCEFTNFLSGEDCLATLNAFKEMGIFAELSDDKLIIHGVGINGLKKASEAVKTDDADEAVKFLKKFSK